MSLGTITCLSARTPLVTATPAVIVIHGFCTVCSTLSPCNADNGPRWSDQFCPNNANDQHQCLSCVTPVCVSAQCQSFSSIRAWCCCYRILADYVSFRLPNPVSLTVALARPDLMAVHHDTLSFLRSLPSTCGDVTLCDSHTVTGSTDTWHNRMQQVREDAPCGSGSCRMPCISGTVGTPELCRVRFDHMGQWQPGARTWCTQVTKWTRTCPT